MYPADVNISRSSGQSCCFCAAGAPCVEAGVVRCGVVSRDDKVLGLGMFNRGGRNATDGADVCCWGGVVWNFAGCISAGNMSSVDASLFGVTFCWVAADCVDCVRFCERAVFIIGKRMRRLRGAKIIYSPNMVMKMAIAIDT